MSSLTDASVPYPDAFTTATSLVAQWLIARKKLESWLFWIIVDLGAIAIYLYKSLYLTTGLYLIFLILAIGGYFAWKNSYRQRFDEQGADVGEIRSASQGASVSDRDGPVGGR
ncbi:MAG TPA: nicotinamide riboside transporter PnuC [Gammaproteobacteria bacterium]|nr:nicotinamide riboside transporter PnuC [Gammaproteobacteria bacterium]